MAVVPKMTLGIGIGLMAAGVGVWIGGTRGVLAGSAVGAVALVCVNGDVKPLSELLKPLSGKKKAMLSDLIISLTTMTSDLLSLEGSGNMQPSKKEIVRYVILGAQSRGILHQFLKLISG